MVAQEGMYGLQNYVHLGYILYRNMLWALSDASESIKWCENPNNQQGQAREYRVRAFWPLLPN